MKKHKVNNSLRIIAATMLAVISFIFFHSEFDVFSIEADTHSSHDYCQLIDNATFVSHRDTFGANLDVCHAELICSGIVEIPILYKITSSDLVLPLSLTTTERLSQLQTFLI